MEDKLIDKRLRISKITSVRPDYSGTLVSGNYSYGIEPILHIETPALLLSFDFASLYPSTMTMRFPGKNNIRKRKIRNIFPDIE